MTRTPATRQAYLTRARRLMGRCRTDLGVSPGRSGIAPGALVDWLIAQKSGWVAPTWRQNKAAVLDTLTRLIEERTAEHDREADPVAAARISEKIATVTRALERLAAVGSSGCAGTTGRTSARKAKRFPEETRLAVTAALARRRGRHADKLAACLLAGVRTGLRPAEWADTRVIPGSTPDAFMLHVRNAKADAVRAHGPTRTLVFTGLPETERGTILRWLARVQAADAGYAALLTSLGDLLRTVTRTLWPRRITYPTLYSTRHEFAALAKLRFDAAEVAALMGHASDATASRHYGRRRSSRSMPPEFQTMLDRLPRPNPDEVRRVRRKIDASRARLLDFHATAGAAPVGP